MAAEGKVRVMALWQATAGRAEEVAALLGELQDRTLAEEGCVMFEVWRAAGPGDQYVLIEEYAGEAARAEHLGADHFRELVEGRARDLGVRREVRVYTEVGRPGTGAGPGEGGEERDGEA